MTEHDRIEEDVHPVAMLLPWYRSGKLNAEEHRQVADHLAECRQCREELEELTWLRAAVGSAYAEQAGPSPDLFRRVTQRLEEGAQPRRAEEAPHNESPGLLDRLERGLRGFYAPKWAPVLASGLIVVQLTALVWLLNSPERPATQKSPVMERSVPRPVSRIHVAFQADAPAREVERVIRSIKGRIVDGPRQGGLSFVLEVPVTDQGEIDQLLKHLSNESTVVQTAEQVF